MDQKKALAREHLLEAPYGRFELITGIIPHDILMGKPRIVIRYMCWMLEINTTQVNYPALTAWLRKYKKIHEANMSILNTDSSKNISNKNLEDLFNFKPTDPFANPKQEPPLIKIL